MRFSDLDVSHSQIGAYQDERQIFKWADEQPKRLKPEAKAELIAGLASGEYKQGHSVLRTKDGKFCCLGVRTDQYVKAGKGEWIESSGKEGYPDYQYNSGEGFNWSGYTLSAPIILADGWCDEFGLFATWAELPKPPKPGDFQIIPSYYQEGYTLAELNDSGFTFAQIIDIINYFL